MVWEATKLKVINLIRGEMGYVVFYSHVENKENQMDFKEISGGWKIRSSDWLDVEETRDMLEVIKIRDGGLVVKFSSHIKVLLSVEGLLLLFWLFIINQPHNCSSFIPLFIFLAFWVPVLLFSGSHCWGNKAILTIKVLSVPIYKRENTIYYWKAINRFICI